MTRPECIVGSSGSSRVGSKDCLSASRLLNPVSRQSEHLDPQHLLSLTNRGINPTRKPNEEYNGSLFRPTVGLRVVSSRSLGIMAARVDFLSARFSEKSEAGTCLHTR